MERACQAIGLLGVSKEERRLLAGWDVIPLPVDLLRNGDGRQDGASLQSLMLWVGYRVMKINCIRETARAGAIPLYAELLQGLLDPMGREIAQDVFCLLAVDESSAVVIAEHACSKNSHRW